MVKSYNASLKYSLLKHAINIKKTFLIKKIQIFNNELIIYSDLDYFLQTCLYLKNHVLFQYKMLSAVSGVDYYLKKNRFEIVYELLSIRFNSRIRLKISGNEISEFKSCTKIFYSANWWEREIWDLYGVFFQGHPDLRRILTDYGFEGHPLRKDFPLTGFVEVRYDVRQRRVIYESLQSVQQFRVFDFSSVWIYYLETFNKLNLIHIKVI